MSKTVIKMTGRSFVVVDTFTGKVAGYFNSAGSEDFQRYIKQSFTETYKRNPNSLDGLEVHLLRDWEFEGPQDVVSYGPVATLIADLLA